VSGGIINIIPKLPSADDEYTPAQRRIHRRPNWLRAAKGPYHGPFDTADEMIAHIKGELKKRRALKKSKPLPMKAEYSDAVNEALETAPRRSAEGVFQTSKIP